MDIEKTDPLTFNYKTPRQKKLETLRQSRSPSNNNAIFLHTEIENLNHLNHLSQPQLNHLFSSALREGDLSTVKALIENGHVKLEDLESQSVLLNSANIWKHTEIFQYLILKGAKLNSETLVRASANEKLETAYQILQSITQEDLNTVGTQKPSMLREIIEKFDVALLKHQINVFTLFRYMAFNEAKESNPFSKAPLEINALILCLFLKSYYNENDKLDKFRQQRIELNPEKVSSAMVLSTQAIEVAAKPPHKNKYENTLGYKYKNPDKEFYKLSEKLQKITIGPRLK